MALVQRNWLIGYRIAEEELQGDNRAEYGASIIKKLAKELTAEYGKGYTKKICIIFICFTKRILRFSTRQVENYFFLGHITVPCCK